jgi:hypothetical protein
MPHAKGLTRDEKVENLLVNFSMIMMGMFEGVFAALAAGMADSLTKTAEALTEAMDSGKGATHLDKTNVSAGAEVNSKVKDVFAGLRKEVAEGFSNKDAKFQAFIKDSAFDEGIRVVERHRLKVPSLTERLSDADLAEYVNLIQAEDPEVAKMMQELGEWQKTAPRFEQRQ